MAPIRQIATGKRNSLRAIARGQAGKEEINR
jgi:hypothetical protein